MKSYVDDREEMSEYPWDTIFQLFAEENLEHYVSISQLKRAVQDDNPDTLSMIIGNHEHAAIYALIHCFIKPPPIRCIHYLVSKGTPLHQTFPHNPFRISPQEWLLTRFSVTNPTYVVIKQTIDGAKKQLKRA